MWNKPLWKTENYNKPDPTMACEISRIEKFQFHFHFFVKSNCFRFFFRNNGLKFSHWNFVVLHQEFQNLENSYSFRSSSGLSSSPSINHDDLLMGFRVHMTMKHKNISWCDPTFTTPNSFGQLEFESLNSENVSRTIFFGFFLTIFVSDQSNVVLVTRNLKF